MEHDAVRTLRHDLRSPLMVVTGFARLLAADGPIGDAERRDFARRIEAAGEEMRRIVDEFDSAP